MIAETSQGKSLRQSSRQSSRRRKNEPRTLNVAAKIRTSFKNKPFVASFVANFVDRWAICLIDKVAESAMIAETSQGKSLRQSSRRSSRRRENEPGTLNVAAKIKSSFQDKPFVASFVDPWPICLIDKVAEFAMIEEISQGESVDKVCDKARDEERMNPGC